MQRHHIVIVGTGIGGLVAALLLAAAGVRVTVLERADQVGGKMREVAVGGVRIDAGPTVFTMRWVFEEIFAAAGARFAEAVTLRPAETLARHAWDAGAHLDLFADIGRSADAIGSFAGAAEARGYRAFCARAERIYATLEGPFIRAAQPTPASLVQAAGLRGLGDLWRIAPFQTLWRALGDNFRDPRLRQLFGRYATYNGSSPFAAPATLMLIAHVERDGVWLVEGGMHRIARALADLARRHGATIRTGAAVAEILVAGRRARGVRLADGERIEADGVVANADTAALAAGLLGVGARAAAPALPPAERSLSALTWTMVAETAGFPLLRHNVFFSADYAAEFAALFGRARLPEQPTVYICAQDRDDRGLAPPGGPERLFCLVNAPPTGDARSIPAEEIARCESRTFALLQACGLTVRRSAAATVLTTPTDFDRMFPGSGGALYGRAVHGSTASFRRPGARSRVPGLYLAGGTTHPGAGVPMAALSGRLAASAVMADLAST